MLLHRILLLAVLFVSVLPGLVLSEDYEKAGVYRKGSEVSDFLVSEKLDGVWARWDGKRLVSRNGIEFAAPPEFIRGFPDTVLEGELWAGRHKFNLVSRTVRDKQPGKDWFKLKFMVFDASTLPGTFAERYTKYSGIIRSANAPYLDYIRQREIYDGEELFRFLDEVVRKQGEGLILHRKTAPYDTAGKDNVLKLKKFDDAEAEVTGYNPGRGRLKGMTGSLKVRWEGKDFSIGSGLTDKLRKNPPPIGTLITFKYYGLTVKGLPRFPVFWRERNPGF